MIRFTGTRTILVALVAGCLVISACTAADNEAVVDGVIMPATRGTEHYTLGQSVYAANCASCHGAEGQGQFPSAPLQRDDTGRYGAPPHDGSGHTWHHDDDLLIRYVREGGMGDPSTFYPMPGYDDVLSNEEITAVLAYIKTMWQPEQQANQRQATIFSRQQGAGS